MGFHENPNRLINNNGSKEIWYDPYNPKRTFDIRTKEDLTKDATFVGYVDQTPPPPSQSNEANTMTAHYDFNTTGDACLTCEWCGHKTNHLIDGLCSYCFRSSGLQGNLRGTGLRGSNKQPYVCPICRGTGKVPRGYYCRSLSDTFVSTGGEEDCRACKGTGVLWG